jgi:hypothetical protein
MIFGKYATVGSLKEIKRHRIASARDSLILLALDILVPDWRFT